jgi:hypothetical protein
MKIVHRRHVDDLSVDEFNALVHEKTGINHLMILPPRPLPRVRFSWGYLIHHGICIIHNAHHFSMNQG